MQQLARLCVSCMTVRGPHTRTQAALPATLVFKCTEHADPHLMDRTWAGCGVYASLETNSGSTNRNVIPKIQALDAADNDTDIRGAMVDAPSVMPAMPSDSNQPAFW